WRVRVNKRDDQYTCDVSICGDIFVLADLNGPQYVHQHANAGAVMVEACRSECRRVASKSWSRSAGSGADQCDEALAVLSTLSPIAAAAGVLLADDVAISRMAEAIHDGPLGAEGHWFSAATEQGGWCVDVVRAGLRALAEQEKADD
ncbi:MAG: hypothetical protein ACRCSX_00390, partial [Allorhizobium sp.]